MHLVRNVFIYAFAGAMVIGSYFAGGYTAGLLVAGSRAMAPASVAADVADQVATR